jgi:hypothetical protein
MARPSPEVIQGLLERLTQDVLKQLQEQTRGLPTLQLSIIAFDMEAGASHSWKGDRREVVAALRAAADRIEGLPPRVQGES